MTWWPSPFPLVVVSMLAVLVPLRRPAAEDDCRPCHAKQVSEFAASAMAGAASSADYRREEAAADPRVCRGCHAPTGRSGVTCVDCHAGDPHAGPTAPTMALCGRCHDAQGETTVAAYSVSAARQRGLDCRDCHSQGGRDHSFIGPTHFGFLDSVAQLRLMMVSETLIVRINHRAGHRLPGGTTGRAVWLRLWGVDAEQKPTWRQDIRYGWSIADGVWQDHSLPPDNPVMIRIENPRRSGSRRVEAELVYRFSAGSMDDDDPRQVVLDKAGVDLP